MNITLNDTPRRLRACAFFILSCVALSVRAATYYVNYSTGSDAPTNLGTSEASPWKTLARLNAGPQGLVDNQPSTYLAGDVILLARGAEWVGEYLAPRGSGTSVAPITVDAYGTGVRPLIQARGAVLPGNSPWSAAVWLFNQQHWAIRNLDLRNFVTEDTSKLESLATINQNQDGFRCGILVEAENASGLGQLIGPVNGRSIHELSGIRLEKCRIRHVEGYDDLSGYSSMDRKSTGGIHFRIRSIAEASLVPNEDAYVRDGTYEELNYGTVNPLQIKAGSVAGYRRNGYLKFSLSSVDGHVGGARLRVYGRNLDDSSTISLAVAGVPITWTETDLKWINAPAGTDLGSISLNGQAGYSELDVTDYIRQCVRLGHTAVAFQIRGTSRLAEIFSREDTNATDRKPRLEIANAPTRFANVLIAENLIEYVNSTGITTRSDWNPELGSDDDAIYRWPGFVVRDNVVLQTAKDGMIIRNTVGAIIERNVIGSSNQRSKWNGVGVFAFYSSGTVVQYNEIYGTKGFLSDTGEIRDGQGMDIDYQQEGTIFQHNYSHDNQGGFMISTGDRSYGYTSRKSIVRYNLSQNDGGRIFRLTGGSEDIQIYNNTIVVAGTEPIKIVSLANWNGWPRNSLIANNIIHNSNPNALYALGPITGSVGSSRAGGFVFSNNVFFNTAGTPVDQPVNGASDVRYTAAGNTSDDPLLVAPGGAGSGWHGVDAFKLQSGSAALAGGAVIASADTALMPLPTRDYWGHPVANTTALPPSRGAYDGQGVAPISNVHPAAADAGMRDGPYAGTKYGAYSTLDVQTGTSGNNRRSILRFDLTALPSQSIVSAKLQLHGANVTDATSVTVTTRATTDGWNEADIDWNDQPALGAPAGTAAFDATPGYREFDVSNFVQSELQSGGDRVVSLTLTVDVAKRLTFASRTASANPPRLVVVTQPLLASADATVRDGAYKTQNFGTASTLHVEAGASRDLTRAAYLRFNLPTVTTALVKRAVLRLHGNAAAGEVLVRVFRVADTTWTEAGAGGVTYLSAPAPGVPVAVASVNTTLKYYEFDVTDFVQDEVAGLRTPITFVLQALDASAQTVAFSSRESGSNPPQLVLD